MDKINVSKIIKEEKIRLGGESIILCDLLQIIVDQLQEQIDTIKKEPNSFPIFIDPITGTKRGIK